MDLYNDKTKMPFGKYRGKALANVPAVYLLWLLKEGCEHIGLRKYITANLDLLKTEVARLPKRQIR